MLFKAFLCILFLGYFFLSSALGQIANKVEVSPILCDDPNDIDHGVSNIHLFFTQTGFIPSTTSIQTGIPVTFTIDFTPTTHTILGVLIRVNTNPISLCGESLDFEFDSPIILVFEFLNPGPFLAGQPATATGILTVPSVLSGALVSVQYELVEVDVNNNPLLGSPLSCRITPSVSTGSCSALAQILKCLAFPNLLTCLLS